MKFTLILQLIAMSLLPLASGCVVTHDMWEQAKSRRLDCPAVAGCLDKSGQDHPRAIVVEYPVMGMGWFKDRPFYVVLPLNADGSVPEPHVYQGRARDVTEAARGIPPEQLEKIQKVLFSPADFEAGKKALRSPEFRPLDRTPGGVSTIEAFRSSVHGLSVLAYWPAGTAPRQASFNPKPLPPNATMIVLPSYQPRPESDRSANIALATALTPVTVAADLVLDPIGMLVWSIKGDQP